MDAGLHHAWILKPDVVDGSIFVDIYTAEYRCKVCLNNNFAVVERLKKLRDAKAAELMRAVLAEDDPNDTNNCPTERLNRPKRELIDKIPPCIEVEVATRNGVEATVKVLPSWRERQVLQIELSQENLDLLLEEPRAAVSASFAPTISQPDVVWVNGRNHVRCTYWCKRQKRWRIKSRPIEFDQHLNESEKQEVVTREAEEMQRFFLEHHSDPGNESAGSASREPSRKAARMGTSDEPAPCDQQSAD